MRSCQRQPDGGDKTTAVIAQEGDRDLTSVSQEKGSLSWGRITASQTLAPLRDLGQVVIRTMHLFDMMKFKHVVLSSRVLQHLYASSNACFVC